MDWWQTDTILNFLITFPKGTMFLKFVNAFDPVKDAQLLSCLLDQVIVEVQVGNVVRVITDNASNYFVARSMLEENTPPFGGLYVQPIV